MEKVVPRLAVTFWRKKRFEDFVIPNKQAICPIPGPLPLQFMFLAMLGESSFETELRESSATYGEILLCGHD